MTQSDLILEKLEKSNWVCSTQLIDLYSVDYRSVINRLRKKGNEIITKSCDGRCGRNHNARMNMWLLVKRNLNGVVINGE